jgi:transcription-repair coupling factor (superfamily II helicase)
MLPQAHPLSETMLSTNDIPGIEHLLPLFFEELCTLPDYLPSIGTLVLVEPVRISEALESAWTAQTSGFPEGLPFGPGDQFSSPASMVGRLGACPRTVELELAPREDVDFYCHTLPPESFVGHREEMLRQFGEWLGEGYRICVTCDSPAEKEAFNALLPAGIPVEVEVMSLSEGFRMPSNRVVVLPERRLLSGRRRPGIVRRFRGGEAMGDFDDIEPGQLVVHRQYGIGVFRGLERVETGGEVIDCLAIEYADGDRLLVPSSEIGQVHRYMVPGEGTPELDRIGTGYWSVRVSKARSRATEIAGRLAVIYAERQALSRPPLEAPSPLLQALEQTFPFEETPDQANAIARVKTDFTDTRPMDRLVCGDVGYGKTEVALRAAFRAADTGRQVAVLVPTTILAEQHFQTFRDRLAEFPVRVACLSRFQDRSEQEQVLSGLAEGSVSIVVGTHRLLQRDVRFNRLGLVVIDEEHRFGVRQKEYLRELRTGVDTLSLTATPIPRTLHMALSGFRDISIIATPPRDRYPVHTELTTWNPRIIRTAVNRELEREGQVFFVHNRIHTLEEVRRELTEILGGVRIATAHGQMKPHDLEDVMHSFMEGEYDILLSTAIIESGLDLPRVNTIFIDDAHTFGLADLYQLRGRVGRSYHRAYCYLVHPPGAGGLSPDARSRLESIQRYTELGSGWHVAMRDLELRGAGELLGSRQHGQIESIGYSLFEDLIREEAARLRGEAGAARREVRVEIPGEAFLPEDYMPDIVERVRLYRFVWRSDTEKGVEEWKDYVRDRYGELPEPVVNCAERARIRLLAEAAGAEEVVGTSRQVRLVLRPGVMKGAEASRRLAHLPGTRVMEERTGRTVAIVPIEAQGQDQSLSRIAFALRQLA